MVPEGVEPPQPLGGWFTATWARQCPMQHQEGSRTYTVCSSVIHTDA